MELATMIAVLLIGYLFFDSWIEYCKKIRRENERKDNNKRE